MRTANSRTNCRPAGIRKRFVDGFSVRFSVSDGKVRRMRWWQVIRNPPVLCGMRWLLPAGRTRAWRIRRRIRLRAHGERPRWQRGLAFWAGFVCWHGFVGWRSCLRGWRLAARRRFEGLPSRPRLAADLFHLVFWLGAQPLGYFAYRLHARPRGDWEEFVFWQEHASWQCVFGPGGRAGRAAVGDKAGFAEQLTAAGLPAVPLIRRFAKGAPVDLEELLAAAPLFLKPNSANAMRGCLALTRPGGTGRGRLEGRELNGRACCHEDEDAIRDCVQRQVAAADYLAQPLLRNHARILELCPTETLITLRIITLRRPRPAVLYALLEVPAEEPGLWRLAQVDGDTGEIAKSAAENDREDVELRSAIGRRVPDWERCREIALRAHELAPDLATVGWDLAITEDGPVIIEGNSGWDVTPPQAVSGRPLLPVVAPALDDR